MFTNLSLFLEYVNSYLNKNFSKKASTKSVPFDSLLNSESLADFFNTSVRISVNIENLAVVMHKELNAIDNFLSVTNGKNNTILIEYKSLSLSFKTSKKKVDFIDSSDGFIIYQLEGNDDYIDVLLLDFKDLKKYIAMNKDSFNKKPSNDTSLARVDKFRNDIFIDKDINEDKFYEYLNKFNKLPKKSKEIILLSLNN